MKEFQDRAQAFLGRCSAATMRLERGDDGEPSTEPDCQKLDVASVMAAIQVLFVLSFFSVRAFCIAPTSMF